MPDDAPLFHDLTVEEHLSFYASVYRVSDTRSKALGLLDEFESSFSDVELGWTVDPGLNGDSKPHLFTFTFDNGTPGCYNGACGSYVQVSETTFPGMLLTSGSALKLEVRKELSGWWLGVNGACIIAHGGSSPRAVRNAIRMAGEAIRHQVNPHIIEEVQRYESTAAAHTQPPV